MPLRMPEAARTPMTGIMEPVMTPMRLEKPYSPDTGRPS